jgi:hypothetical protein
MLPFESDMQVVSFLQKLWLTEGKLQEARLDHNNEGLLSEVHYSMILLFQLGSAL